MTNTIPRTALELRSLVRSTGELELSLAQTTVPTPADDEVLVRVEAAPINPSDLGLLVGPADLSAAVASGSAARPVVTAPVPAGAMKVLAPRLDLSMPVGNEGAGVVVAAGASPAAQALIGRTVAFIGGGMFAQYRVAKAEQVLLLPEGTTPSEGASCFVNPLTALAMVETMRREGHTALVHTAAASNLGQMLNRICLQDGIPLVNVVRKAEQETLLRGLGATYVCNGSAASFMDDLTDAVAATGATLAFDATGGGTLAGQILEAMETAINRKPGPYSRYGSSVHKQVYVYGRLDPTPLTLTSGAGFAWGVSGFLLLPFLQKMGLETGLRLRARVLAELKTTFASHYSRTVSLAEALHLDVLRTYAQRATGEKYLINPNL